MECKIQQGSLCSDGGGKFKMPDKTVKELEDMLDTLSPKKEEYRAIAEFFNDMGEIELATFFDDIIGYNEKAMDVIKEKLK